MANRRHLLMTSAGVLLAMFVFGFVLFAITVTRGAPTTGLVDASGGPLAGRLADGIVVLTGGEKRIDEALRLLDSGRAGRLLITGVNRKTSRDDVRRLVASTARKSRAFDCCVDIGYDALDTIGNADEARTWVEQRRFNSLIVVTASNHMPRSLAELRLKLPSTLLIPHPVVPNKLRAAPWWLHPEVAKELAFEYLKFLPTAARYLVAQSIRPRAPQTVVQATSNQL